MKKKAEASRRGVLGFFAFGALWFLQLAGVGLDNGEEVHVEAHLRAFDSGRGETQSERKGQTGGDYGAAVGD